MKPLTPLLLALTVWLFADPGAAQESPVNADIVTSAPVVLEGRVLTEDGLPAAGAVVVSSAGGQTVTESNGTFQLEVDLPHGAQSVQVTAVAVRSSEAGVRYAEASLRLAETQWRRVEPLSEIGALPFQDRDKAQAALDGARAGLDNAQAELAQARANLGEADANNPDIRTALAQLERAELDLSYATVAAPVNGYVTDLDLSPGSYASAGSPLLSLVNSDSWRVVAYYKETQLERIRPGQPAAVYLPAYSGVCTFSIN